MNSENQAPTAALTNTPSEATRKLRRLAHLMRMVSAAYAIWVLWKMVSWWTSGDQVVQRMGSYLQRDLTGMTTWQPMAALGFDLAAWILLLLAVVYGWRFLACLTSRNSLSEVAPQHLARCAWFAMACQMTTLLFRPLQTYALTAHLPASEQVFKWALYSFDFLGAIVGLALLMFAYSFTWVLEVVEENRSFV